MKSRVIISSIVRKAAFALTLLAFFGLSQHKTLAQSVFSPKGAGTINLSDSAPSPFGFSGFENHLGEYHSYGEMQTRFNLENLESEGSGIIVFEAANGDRLVGTVALETDRNGTGQITFSWCNSVRFSNGTIVPSTGDFFKAKPADATLPVKTKTTVVIAIIAILIG